MLDRYVVFTSHARSRAREFQITLAKATYLVYTAEKEKLYKDISRYKNERYNGERAMYLRNGTYLFTVLPVTDKHSGDDIYLVLTMYDQRMDV